MKIWLSSISRYLIQSKIKKDKVHKIDILVIQSKIICSFIKETTINPILREPCVNFVVIPMKKGKPLNTWALY